VQLTTVGITLAAKESGSIISKEWILLDIQANVDLLMNPALVTGIRESNQPLTIHTTSGTT
jgi:hypothetical protein